MALKNWTGSVSTDWNNAANWSPSGVPASGDDVTIGVQANLPTLSTSTSVNTITIGAGTTLSLAGAATSLTVTNSISLSGILSGVGTVDAAVAATGGSAQIKAIGGTLEVTGAITDSNGGLTLNIAGASDKLLLDAQSAAHTVTFNSTGTLELNSAVRLTVGSLMAIGAGTLQLDGAGSTLTDSIGVTMSAGTITGAGVVAAAVSTNAASQIIATGGTLEMTGAIIDNDSSLVINIAGASDRLLLDGSGSSAQTVTFSSSGTLELSTSAALTVGTAMAIGTGTLKFGTFSTFTDASGITISTGTIIGAGNVHAPVTATGAANITVTTVGPGLDFFDTITDNGDALTITINSAGATLALLAASAAHTVTFTSGALRLNANATLTVGTAMAVGGQLSLLWSGATLNDTHGVTVGSGGQITGFGSINAGLNGTGTVTASGGTLHLTGSVASGPHLTIDDVTGSVLSIENTAISASPITINTSKKTLSIAATGNLTINGGAESITNGTILITAGSQLSNSSGLTIGSGASLIGAGTVTGPINGVGIVRASGGTLELVSALTAAAGTAFQVANSALAALRLDAAPGTGNTFSFLGANGHLSLANDTGFNDTVSGLRVGASGARTNYVDIEGHTVTITAVTGQGTTSGTITLSDGAVLNLANLSSTGWFVNTVGDGVSGTDIFVSDTACYCGGTLILTDKGELPVETLAIGDRVMTLSGAAVPIKWIGHRAYDGRFVTGNRGVLPIRITADALADGVPARDLWVSPEHALYIDGALVPARQILNGATITQIENVEQLDYFHIELETHDIIFADGAPAESYVDCDNRRMFHNFGEFAPLYPVDDRPAWQFCAPRLDTGSPELAAIRAALLERGEVFGYGLDDDPYLHLIIDGEIMRPHSVAGGIYRFNIPTGSSSVWLASRSAMPIEVEVASSDIRRLGVAVERLVFHSADLSIEVSHGNAALREGFHNDENTHRWTDGLGRLPEGMLRLFDGEVGIEVALAPSELRYRRSPESAAA